MQAIVFEHQGEGNPSTSHFNVGYPSLFEEKGVAYPAARVAYPSLFEEKRVAYPAARVVRYREKEFVNLHSISYVYDYIKNEYDTIMSKTIDALEPEDLLKTFIIKKLASMIGMASWAEKMGRKEQDYFEDIPAYTEYFKQKDLKQRGKISVREEKARIAVFTKELKGFKNEFGFEVPPAVVKYNIKRLLDRITFEPHF